MAFPSTLNGQVPKLLSTGRLGAHGPHLGYGHALNLGKRAHAQAIGSVAFASVPTATGRPLFFAHSKMKGFCDQWILQEIRKLSCQHHFHRLRSQVDNLNARCQFLLAFGSVAYVN